MTLNTGVIHREEKLILQIAQGDQKAFRRFFEFQEPALLYFAEKLLSDKQQAEDSVLIAFQKFWEQKDHFTTPGAVRSFLYTTVKNLALNHIKRRNMLQATHQAILRESAVYDDAYIEYRMLQSELLAEVYNEIQSLPGNHRQILQLTFIDELSTKEIAQMLSMEESSVRSAKARALVQLRKALAPKQLFSACIGLLLLSVGK
ncbi:MAG: sigma-70 family RNA polymerase sigma factor [Niabella sp.]